MSICGIFGGIAVTIMAFYYGIKGSFGLFIDICLFFKGLFSFTSYGDYIATLVMWTILMTICMNCGSAFIGDICIMGIILAPAFIFEEGI